MKLLVDRFRTVGGVALLVYLAAVAALTSLAAVGVLSESWFASSPRKIQEGKFWLLFTNALVCDHPRGASFFALVLFAVIALWICGSRVLWTTAAMGHVFSTLCVYAMLALIRFVDAGAFDGALSARDIGVSAVCAAWLGAVAAILWRRPGKTRNRKIAIVAGVVVVGTSAYVVNPDLTVLDSDHVFAFVIGAAVALVPVRALVKADAVYAFSAAAYARVRAFVVAAARALRTKPVRQ